MSKHLPISEEDLEAFSCKLLEWGEKLPLKERALLHLMIDSAVGQDPKEAELSDSQLDAVAGGASAVSPGGLSLRMNQFFQPLLRSPILLTEDQARPGAEKCWGISSE